MLWYRSSTIFDHELLKHKKSGWRGTQCTVNRQLKLVYTVWCFSNRMLTTFLVNRGTWPRKTWVAFPLSAWVVLVSGILTKWWWQMGHKLERRLVRVMVRMPRCIRTQPFYSGSCWNISYGFIYWVFGPINPIHSFTSSSSSVASLQNKCFHEVPFTKGREKV